MLICSRHIVGDTEVRSSSGTKVYTVHVSPEGGAHCTCPDWNIKRNKLKKEGYPDPDSYQCKHIKGLLQSNGCDWTENDKVTAEFETVCPKCFAKTKQYQPSATNPTEEQLDAAIQDILAWRSQLLGTEPSTAGSP